MRNRFFPARFCREIHRLNFSTRFWLAQAAALVCIQGAQAEPAKFTWDGGGTDSNWSTPANWAGDVAPPNPTLPEPAVEPVILTLGGSTRLSPVVDAAWTLDRLYFGAGAESFHLTGETITFLPTNGTSHDSRHFIVNDSGKTQTIDNDLVLTSVGAGIAVGSGHLILNGNLHLESISGLRFLGGSGTLTINGVISGTFGDRVAINGGTTVVLNNVNTFVSNFTVWSGAARVTVDSLNGEAGALGKSSNAVTMGHGGSSGARLLASEAVTIGRDVSLVRNTNNRPYTIGGDTAHVSHFTGVIYTGSNNDAANAAIVTAAAEGRVNVNSITRRDTATSASLLQDTVTKQGAGIVALTGSSNYSGATNVNEGTLLVNGTLMPQAQSDVVVAAGAVLGGTGLIYRNTVIAEGGIFSPGDINASGLSEGGTLTVGFGLSFADTSSLRFDLGAPTSLVDDEVYIDGSLTLDGILNVTALSGFGPGSYKLFGFTDAFVDNGLIFGDMPAGFDYSYSVDVANSAVYLDVQAIPEPATGALVGLGAALAMFRRRRP